MRRAEKEITDQAEIDEIVRQARVVRLAMIDGARPYMIPMLYGFDGDHLFLHSARGGRKVDVLRENPEVCFECEVGVVLRPTENICSWSVDYRSVIGYGRAVFLEDEVEKQKAMETLLEHYADPPFEMPAPALASTCMIRVDIQSMTGKRSG